MNRVARGCACIALSSLACVVPSTSPAERTVEAEVRAELADIATDLAREGPEGWLPHFVRDGTFWMASEGELKFPTYAEAERAVRAFASSIARMELSWPDPRIEVLEPWLATFGVDYTELLVDGAGDETRFRGHVTGLFVRTDAGWFIRQLHWSMLPPSLEEGAD